MQTRCFIRLTLAVAGIAAWRCVALAMAQSPEVALRTVTEVWRSTGFTPSNTDSLAAAVVHGNALVFATSKDGHRIEVLNAETGRFLRSVGTLGAGPGEFSRPNGIAAIELPVGKDQTRTALAVVERDNKRVQFLWADTFESAGMIRGEFHKPYGVAVSRRDGIVLFISDTEVPAERTIHRVEVRTDGKRIFGEWSGAFGAADGDGRIHVAESLLVDDRASRLLVCDEDPEQRDVKVYSLDGEYTGQRFGREQIQREPEGLILLDAPGDGVIIVTDQRKEQSDWHVFRRSDYRHLAAFTGAPRVANTDGIAVWTGPIGAAAQGLFFAVDDDAQIASYDLRDILALIRD